MVNDSGFEPVTLPCGKGFGENEGGLEIGCGAEGKAFLAVSALVQGYFRDEPYLPSCSAVGARAEADWRPIISISASSPAIPRPSRARG